MSQSRQSSSRLFFAAAFAVCVIGCHKPPGAASTDAEYRATTAYETAVHLGPPALRAFLTDFPKGADLHVHLSGAVYAETFIREAAEDGLCVDPAELRFVPPPCSAKLISAKELTGNISGADQVLYDKLIDSFSVRSYFPTQGWSEHDQFFATFGRFGGLKDHTADWVDEVASRAAAQNQQYLELMVTPAFGHAAQVGRALGWSSELAGGDPAALDRLRQQLIEKGVLDEVSVDRDAIRGAEAKRRQMERCGTADEAPACHEQVRFIYQVLRGAPPEQVFAQTLLGFETIKASMDAHEAGFVGINFVQPEDGFISMRDYTLQMKMVGYLHTVYPQVPITLHAGELKGGLVPPEGLRFHVKQAVEVAHALRIGHGVDVMNEDNARGLLREMAQNHIMVEINLSSNEGILGVAGDEHPFAEYRWAHVPVALSTDDEGVSRIDITHEYVRAANDYGLSYVDLKQLARTGMEHNFLPGENLWAQTDLHTSPVDACRRQVLGGDSPSEACKAFLDKSEKANAEWELERRFRAFEARF